MLYLHQRILPLAKAELDTIPQRRSEPHCGREILFPIKIEAGMRLPQRGRLVGSFDYHSPPYQGGSTDRIGKDQATEQ